MRIKETKIYTFAELDDRAKEKARDWYRALIDDLYWSECPTEDATNIAIHLGISQGIKWYWSGFSSQGDGACFEGQWYASDYKEGLATEWPTDTKLHAIDAGFRDFVKRFPGSSFTAKQRGRYHSTDCTVHLGTDEDECDIDDLAAEEEISTLAGDLADWFYRYLEKEYEYGNADEQVDETILANEYEFTKEGQRA